MARVLGIEITPARTWCDIDGETGGNPAVILRNSGAKSRLWLEKQQAEGRIPAKYFQLRVRGGHGKGLKATG